MALPIMNLWINPFEICLYSTWDSILRKDKSLTLHIMKACCVVEAWLHSFLTCGGIAPFILNLGSRWRWMVNLGPDRFTSGKRAIPIPIELVVGWTLPVGSLLSCAPVGNSISIIRLSSSQPSPCANRADPIPVRIFIHVKLCVITPLKTKCRLLYLKTQFVPRTKHFSSRL